MRACAPRALPVGYDGYGFQPTSLDWGRTHLNGMASLIPTHAFQACLAIRRSLEDLPDKQGPRP